MNNKNMNRNENIIIIRDIKSIFLTVAVIIGGFYILFSNIQYLGEPESLIPVIIICIAFFRLKVVYEGIKIDINTDTLSFPGGGISFNSIEETISNLHQFLKRYTHKISNIQYIKAEDKRIVTKEGKIIYTYILAFTTVHNTASLKFSSSAKRDQVYSIIANINDMGVLVNMR